MHDRPPVPFVVGSPRSGTTLLRLILDAHPDLCIPPETGFLLEPFEEAAGDPAERFADLVTGYPPGASAWPDFGIDDQQFRSALAAEEPFTVAAGVRTFYRLYAARHGKTRWGDKTPLYCRHVARILDLLPEAHVVHLVRDGRDVAVSLRQLWFSPGGDAESQAHFWRANVEAAIAQGRGHSRYLELRYEDLVGDLEGAVRRLCRFLSLDYAPPMLRHHERASRRLLEHLGRFADSGEVVVTREDRLRQQRRVTEPVDARSVGGWRVALSDDEVNLFEAVAGDLLARLGYSLSASPPEARVRR